MSGNTETVQLVSQDEDGFDNATWGKELPDPLTPLDPWSQKWRLANDKEPG